MDGVEFRAMQRAISSIADVPVVVLTADRRLAASADQLSVACTLSKSVDTTRLLEALRNLSEPARPAI